MFSGVVRVIYLGKKQSVKGREKGRRGKGRRREGEEERERTLP